jgi:hypothetical protein
VADGALRQSLPYALARGRVAHAQGLEQALLEKLRVGKPRRALHDVAHGVESEVRVVESLPEPERRSDEPVASQRLRARQVDAGHVLAGRPVAESRPIGEQVAHAAVLCHPGVGELELRDAPADRIVEAELSLRDQQGGGGGDVRLRAGAHVECGAARDGIRVSDAADAVAAREGPVPADRRDASPDDAVVLELGLDELVDGHVELASRQLH